MAVLLFTPVHSSPRLRAHKPSFLLSSPIFLSPHVGCERWRPPEQLCCCLIIEVRVSRHDASAALGKYLMRDSSRVCALLVSHTHQCGVCVVELRAEVINGNLLICTEFTLHLCKSESLRKTGGKNPSDRDYCTLILKPPACVSLLLFHVKKRRECV